MELEIFFFYPNEKNSRNFSVSGRIRSDKFDTVNLCEYTMIRKRRLIRKNTLIGGKVKCVSNCNDRGPV